MLELFIILGVILVLFGLYDFLPNYYARNKSGWVKKEVFSQVDNKVIALTFDDGPDSRYTGQVLDILKEYQVKATFFIVVKNALQCPDEIERMKKEGHAIAMHAFQHKSAWLSFPWETKRGFERCSEYFLSINQPMYSFRPPWGTFNAVSLKYAIKKGLNVILWTVEAFDWRSKTRPEQICEEILRRIKDRGIIVLHDSGGAKGAPEHTIAALRDLIPLLIAQGYQFVTIQEGMN